MGPPTWLSHGRPIVRILRVSVSCSDVAFTGRQPAVALAALLLLLTRLQAAGREAAYSEITELVRQPRQVMPLEHWTAGVQWQWSWEGMEGRGGGATTERRGFPPSPAPQLSPNEPTARHVGPTARVRLAGCPNPVRELACVHVHVT